MTFRLLNPLNTTRSWRATLARALTVLLFLSAVAPSFASPCGLATSQIASVAAIPTPGEPAGDPCHQALCDCGLHCSCHTGLRAQPVSISAPSAVPVGASVVGQEASPPAGPCFPLFEPPRV